MRATQWSHVLYRVLGALLALALMQALCIGVGNDYVRYNLTHNIPNPVWAYSTPQYTYTPDAGSPGPGLLDTRPDEVVRQILADYIRVAGTYPCVNNPSDYSAGSDSFLGGEPCTIHRPVIAYAVSSVTVRDCGSYLMCNSGPSVVVDFTVTYAGGTSSSFSAGLRPHTYSVYWTSFIHLNCWGGWATEELYPYIDSHVPHGVEYTAYTRNSDGYAAPVDQCQP